MKNIISQDEKNRIDLICYEYKIKDYTINSDGTIDVDNDVNIRNVGIYELPINFNRVLGNFDCGRCELTTLVGAPLFVSGMFACEDNKLTSLKGGPKHVNGSYSVSQNKLTSLVGAPKYVRLSFNCTSNEISDLVGAPEFIGRDLYCYNNPNLRSTYSGDVDIELGGELIYGNCRLLPQMILNNPKYTTLILKYQRHFEVYDDYNCFDEAKFQILIDEILDGLL